ncbi:DUF2470 domain-containing protein [Nocardioides daejeonensis]|uniref:DUF2470 domain-containing protein n=1 Tax=Nocardioides daejeonensis TaxID=1046556 RepID=UPI000D74A882|nr:DUF2470 domain-containing protein [Nocardioides daejeonensis]
MSLLRSRPSTPTSGLTPAERVRSILATTSDLRVGVLNMAVDVPRHALAADGSLLFLPGSESPERVFAVAPNLPAQTVQVTANDLAPVAHPDRVRGLVQMTGKLGVFGNPLPAGAREHLAGPNEPVAGEPVLRFVPQRIALTWHCETAGEAKPVEVALDDYRNSFPDPLVGLEDDWLNHMHRDHAHALAALARYVAPSVNPTALRPMQLDRYGLVLRLEDGAERHDVRVPFRHPVRCGCEVREAFADVLRRADPAASHDIC